MGFLSNPWSKAIINAAAPKKSIHNLDCNHYTTFQFGEVRPVYYRHLVEGDKIKVDLTQMVRTAPLVVPTYADVRFRYHGFFVPYRLLMKYFEDFMYDNNVQWSDGQLSIPKVPTFTSSALTNMFMRSSTGSSIVNSVISNEGKPYIESDYKEFLYLHPALDANGNIYSHSAGFPSIPIVSLEQDPTDIDYDVKIAVQLELAGSSSDSYFPVYEYFKLTPKGKTVLKILYSLGYKFNWVSSSFYTQISQDSIPTFIKDVGFNAFGLLSYFLIFNQYFTLSQYRPSKKIISVIQRISEGLANGPDYNILNSDILYQLFEEIEPVFDSNYFTSAWQQPNAVVEGVEPIQNSSVNSLSLSNLSSEFTDYQQRVNPNGLSDSQEFNVESSSSTGTRTDPDRFSSSFSLDYIKKLQDFIRRRLLSGSSASSNVLSEMGVSVPSKDIDFVQRLGMKEVPLQIMDVTNVSESDTAKLGEFGGRAIAPSNEPLEFNYSAEERGIFMIISDIIPPFEVVQGFDRHNVDKSLYDFFRPDFEDVGLQPILQGEICSIPQIGVTQRYHIYNKEYVTKNLSIADFNKRGISPNSIYGFSLRYGHYKTAQSWLSGDFSIGRINGVNQDLANYHLCTLRGIYEDADADYVAMTDLNYVNARQYNRIFNVTDENYDHFFAILHFKVTMKRPMLSVAKSWNVKGSGDETSISTNGN